MQIFKDVGAMSERIARLNALMQSEEFTALDAEEQQDITTMRDAAVAFDQAAQRRVERVKAAESPVQE